MRAVRDAASKRTSGMCFTTLKKKVGIEKGFKLKNEKHEKIFLK